MIIFINSYFSGLTVHLGKMAIIVFQSLVQPKGQNNGAKHRKTIVQKILYNIVNFF